MRYKMKTVLIVIAVSVVSAAVLVGGFFVWRHYDKDVSCCNDKACVTCTCPCTTKNNVLRWVRDPNVGTLYYGWYENDGSAFNYVATASRNHRMGNVAESNVPAHRWVQVD